jgi:hypothetical protein
VDHTPLKVQRLRKDETLSQARTWKAGATSNQAAEPESEQASDLESYVSDNDESLPQQTKGREGGQIFTQFRANYANKQEEVTDVLCAIKDKKPRQLAASTTMYAASEGQAAVKAFTPDGEFPADYPLHLYTTIQEEQSRTLSASYGCHMDSESDETLMAIALKARGKDYNEVAVSHEDVDKLTGENVVMAIDTLIQYMISDRPEDCPFLHAYLRHFQVARTLLAKVAKGAWVLNYELAVRSDLKRDPRSKLADAKSQMAKDYRAMYIDAPKARHEERQKLAAAAKSIAAASTIAADQRSRQPPHAQLTQKAGKKPSAPPCRDFNAGKCTRGDGCRFNHICSHAKCLPKSYPHALKVCRNAAAPADG